MKKRQKASDVFRESKHVFGDGVPFEEAFPEIKEAKVVCVQKGDGVREASAERVYTSPRIGEFVDCSNPACYNGGFSVGQILRDMVRKKQTHLEDGRKCQGYEGSLKGRRKYYRPCFNHWDITVDVVYHEEETEESSR